MNKNPIEIMYSNKIGTENIKVGMILLDNTTNPKIWYLDEELIMQIKEYELTENKLPIRGNKLTGKFLEFKYFKDNPEK